MDEPTNRPLKIGVTGGIGSGKTLVCQVFSVLGAPVFDADREAKALMETDEELVEQIRSVFGEEVYDAVGKLQRGYLASKVFDNPPLLERLNQLVHPVVIRAGEEWSAAQQAPYTVKEAALLFESGSYRMNDFNILVTAPVEVRIQRVMTRDQASRKQVEDRIARQWPDSKKEKLADFIIVNDEVKAVLPQVLALHHRFLAAES